MKKIIFILSMFLCVSTFAQTSTDSLKTDSVKKKKPKVGFDYNITLASRNIWRGLDYGSSPNLSGDFRLAHKYFNVGFVGTMTLNGSKTGFGNWIELYATGKYKNFFITVDDYFFFNEKDSLNNYFDWRPATTQHLMEVRAGYDNDKFGAFAGYCFYANQMADIKYGVYLEAYYRPHNNFSFFMSALTGPSWLSFYDKGGITSVGINGHYDFTLFKKLFKAKVSLIFNPNYMNASTGVGNNPIYFVASLGL